MCIIVNPKVQDRPEHNRYHQLHAGSVFLLSMEDWIKVSIPWFIYPIFVTFPNHIDAFLQYSFPDWSLKKMLYSDTNYMICRSTVFCANWTQRIVLKREIMDRAVQFIRMLCFFVCWVLALVKSYQTRNNGRYTVVYASEPLKNSEKGDTSLTNSVDVNDLNTIFSFAVLPLWVVLLPFWIGMALFIVPMVTKIKHLNQIHRILNKRSKIQ